MAETAEHKVDRAGWPEGEWNSEPDRVDFVRAGFACLLLRNQIGAWCGYVGVPGSHAAFGKHYDDVSAEVHGGLTYSNTCQGAVCHVPPAPGMPDKVWWFGFDTAHCGDAPPGMPRIGRGSYKNLDYVMRETESLAQQLAAL